jgi:hypothetical protein
LNVIKGIVKNYETMKRDASKKLDTYVEDRSAYMEIQLIPITQNGHAGNLRSDIIFNRRTVSTLITVVLGPQHHASIPGRVLYGWKHV